MKLAPIIRPQFDFATKLNTLKGVGSHTERCLKKLGLHSFFDALVHIPIRYEDRSRLTSIRDFRTGQKIHVQGQVIDVIVHRHRKRWLEVVIEEHGLEMSIVLFHFSEKQKEVLMKKPWIRCFGEVLQKARKWTMVHPEMRFISGVEEPLPEGLTPIYPCTEGLYQNVLRQLILTVVDSYLEYPLKESLPETFIDALQLCDFSEALLMIHKPTVESVPLNLEMREHPALKRLICEELLSHQLALRAQRSAFQKEKAVALTVKNDIVDGFKSTLPFKLTNAQDRAFESIASDMRQQAPMMRLIQGDVGSGKTVVAALASLVALSENKQVALLAPTEILASQHYQLFSQWLEPLGIKVAFLSGKTKAKEKKIHLAEVAEQSPLMVVGTHAMFQQQVVFKDLALMIVDEQHRFGVLQRLQLRDKGAAYVPHQLVMTATPIPRSLAMTRWADLDLTVIDELPPNRQSITTLCVSQERRYEMLEKVRAVVKEGQQVYWVCPLIEESEKLQAQAVTQAIVELQQALPQLKIGCIHGKLKAAEKEQIMQDFKASKLDLLVATTVIEVGVNVPNATLMIIENAERLGLAQLHQLRGRVGRGAEKSYCVLLYKGPLSECAKKRLEVMRQSQDGFKIAEMDLKIRGPGEVIGVRQTGVQAFKVADLLQDGDLIAQINPWARKLVGPDAIEIESNLTYKWRGALEQTITV